MDILFKTWGRDFIPPLEDIPQKDEKFEREARRH